MRALPSWTLTRKQRNGTDAEIDGTGLKQGRSILLCPQAYVRYAHGKQLRPVEGNARRAERGVYFEPEKIAYRRLGLVAQSLGADAGGGAKIDEDFGDDGDRGEQRRDRREAAQHPAPPIAAPHQVAVAFRRWEGAQLAYFVTAKPDLFVFW